uniref:Uncharacterized protein n=1 Tax=Chlamydomonas leiostraca TaxID=1034604 RepID=A0A7S0WTB5_9CHLO|eukprot:CAMPEP_0202857488 /NCGR_PEP_ID=MMETSP1391-20130828/408_1 /ASSEMBLY_ACC=CAM_ASM_000867 /TAXON_ID=1034604 /ORGANISM="Chlamydomonas leiostraca, Strain SAG 11-49" /LENGTH=234 /DNA_ID=CAMNT_0049536293 /DNA_START=34 /DNA_END=738 /DNA_ORIENTATION=+
MDLRASTSGRSHAHCGHSQQRMLLTRTTPRVRAQSRKLCVVPKAFTSSCRELLREYGSIGDDTYSRVNALHGGLLDDIPADTKLMPVLHHLTNNIGLSSQQLQTVLVKHPKVFTYALDDVQDVTAFLTNDLGLSQPDVQAVVSRYPAVFSYSVKGHLRPQLAYLTSLGVQDVAAAVVARPMLLGEGIETVIRFLKVCGVPRRQMASLIVTYPIDYCCRFIFSAQATRGGSQPTA